MLSYINFLRKYFVSLILLGIILTVLPTTTFAQSTYEYNPQQTQAGMQLNSNPDVPSNQRTTIDGIIINLEASAICVLSGIDIYSVDPRLPAYSQESKCLGIDPITKKIGYVSGQEGLIGASGGLIASLYKPPTNSSEYVSYMASNFGITKKAYAQSTGYFANQRLVKVWAVFRDIAYMLMAAAFIIVGFAIMIRVRIDPKTVMSIQNMIPKLVIAIIMITFSYAIAGLMIDIMWASTYISVNVMGTAIEQVDESGVFDTQDAANYLQDYPIKFFNKTFAGDYVGLWGVFEFSRNTADGIGILFRSLTDSGDIGSKVKNAVDVDAPSNIPSTNKLVYEYFGSSLVDAFNDDNSTNTTTADAASSGGQSLGSRLKGFVAGVVAGALNIAVKPILGVLGELVEGAFSVIFGVLSWVFASLAFIVVLIAVLVTLFRVWFTLLKAYIIILLGIVWAPFWILFGVIPSSHINFTQWLRHMAAHLALFPATVVMFMMARVFIQVFEPAFLNTNDKGFFLPPLIGNAGIPEAIGPLIAFGVLMYTPHVLTIVREALKTPPDRNTATAVGAGIAAGVAPVRSTARTAMRSNQYEIDSETGTYKKLGLRAIFK